MRDVVRGDRVGVFHGVGRLWGGGVDGESHEGIGVCEIEHV